MARRQFDIGSDIVSGTTATNQRSIWETIGNSLSENGDILIYACEFASDDDGRATLSLLSSITGADFAASDDITGMSGDWELEVNTGAIEAQALAVENYQHDLINRAPSILVPGLLSGFEGDFVTGLNVDAASSNLMERVSDPDTSDTVFTIATVNGESALTTAKTVFASFSDKNNAQQNIEFDLTVNADGSYTLTADNQSDIDKLERIPNNRMATGSFNYVGRSTGCRSMKLSARFRSRHQRRTGADRRCSLTLSKIPW